MKTKTSTITRYCRRKLRNHHQRFRHWTFIVYDNQFITEGINRDHEPPIFFGYHNLKDGEAFIPKWHSEMDAIAKLLKMVKRLDGMVAINVRLNARGETRMAKPCDACTKILKRFGCVAVWYTTDDGWEFVEL